MRAPTDKRRRLFVACLLTACGSDAEPLVAPGNPTAQATLVVTVLSESEVFVEAIEGDGAGRIEVPLDGDRTVWVLHYERTLAALQLAPGLVAPAGPMEASRPLPPFDDGRRVVVVDGDTLGFEEVTALEGEAADFRIPGVGGPACLENGGCFVEGFCATPCPERDAVNAPAPTQPAIEAMPPDFGACASGWEAVDRFGASTCLPPERVATCEVGSFQAIDAAICAPIAACPAGAWPSPIPAGARWFVQAGAAGGNGSMGAPFGTLAAAFTRAAPDDVIVLAKGTYAAPAALDRAVTIAGACPAETFLERAGPVTVSAEVALSGVTLTSAASTVNVLSAGSLRLDAAALASPALVTLAPGASMTTDRVRVDGRIDADAATVSLSRTTIEGAVGPAVRTRAGAVTLADVVVADVGLLAANGEEAGDGVLAYEGASVVADRLLVERASAYGVRNIGSVVQLTDVVVRGTRARTDETGGIGVFGSSSSTTTLARAVVADNLTYGVFIQGATAVLDDVVVHGTRARPSNRIDGEGLVLFADARVSGRRVLLADNQHVGFLMRSGVAELDDLTVRDTLGRASDDGSGEGLIIEDGARVTLRRTLVVANRAAGLQAVRAPDFDVEDFVVRDTRANANGNLGEGIRLESGTTGRFVRVLSERNRHAGIRMDASGRVDFEDVTIRQTARASLQATVARGLDVDASPVFVDRLTVVECEGFGVLAQNGGTLNLRDATILDNRDPGLVARGGSLTAARVVAARNRLVNVSAREAGILTLSDITVSGARSMSSALAIGVQVDLGSSASLTRFLIEDNEGAGCLQRTDATLSLTNGTVRDHAIGLLLGDTDFDLVRYVDHVAFVNNVEAIAAP